MQKSLTWSKLPAGDLELALANRVYLSQDDFNSLCEQDGSEGPVYVDVKGCVFCPKVHPDVQKGFIALSDPQRKFAKVGLEKEVLVRRCAQPPIELGSCFLEAGFLKSPPANTRKLEVLDTDLEKQFREMFSEHVVALDQRLFLRVSDVVLEVTVKGLKPLDLGDQSAGSCWPVSGTLGNHTQLIFQASAAASAKLEVLSDSTVQRTIFQPDFNFEELGIGGLSREFANIFRRAFAARVFPPRVVRALGIKHVRGMLLYGPPGTGKTLIARQLAKFLQAAEPKIINGPELLDKMVGETERKVRALFADAENDQRLHGESSQLHVIVLDEIDSICKTRGASRDSTGVSDNIVNQFLTKIDGVEALNNVLLIGMTNRKDMLDPALLRAGRLELHVEISLPDAAGRAEILNIHTAKMRESGLLDSAVDVGTLAERTPNYSGAELESLVSAAAASAMNQKVDLHNLSKAKDLDTITVTAADFEAALTEVRPAFGQDSDALEQAVPHGILSHSREFDQVLQKCEHYIEQLRSSQQPLLLSTLLSGIPGSGKTALAAHLARRSDFPFIRRISSENFASESEQGKLAAISKAFDDAHKSPLSLIILDDVERLIDYASIGNRFSNSVLQLLFGLLKKRPAKVGHRMLIIGTTSEPGFLGEVKLLRAFSTTLTVPPLSSKSSFEAVLAAQPGFGPDLVSELACTLAGNSMGIRSLLEVAEMSAHQQNPVQLDTVLECLKDAGALN
eukprot:TRINITY_DN14084_c0_g1_i1.p1 TRINITY_DN14084_c0_g1~~TRINITY_DN14084_c0_g1_i1.p1  ORF type:complete len:736 (+),score=151.72 TRINITY_DN14084_c0_g1_i1:85-2292(+)